VKIETTRTLDQNAKMWAMLDDVSAQVKWTVNGYLTLMSRDDWKDVFTAGLKKHQRVAQGIEGGWVLLGERTHKFKKEQMAELIEYIYAFGANHGVIWSEPDDVSKSQAA
jgi:hypothetical protein